METEDLFFLVTNICGPFPILLTSGKAISLTLISERRVERVFFLSRSFKISMQLDCFLP